MFAPAGVAVKANSIFIYWIKIILTNTGLPLPLRVDPQTVLFKLDINCVYMYIKKKLDKGCAFEALTKVSKYHL